MGPGWWQTDHNCCHLGIHDSHHTAKHPSCWDLWEGRQLGHGGSRSAGHTAMAQAVWPALPSINLEGSGHKICQAPPGHPALPSFHHHTHPDPLSCSIGLPRCPIPGSRASCRHFPRAKRRKFHCPNHFNHQMSARDFTQAKSQ